MPSCVPIGLTSATTLGIHYLQAEASWLYYFGARYFDRGIGRWLAPDPVASEFSPYSYVHNRPLNYIDRLGLSGDLPPGYEYLDVPAFMFWGEGSGGFGAGGGGGGFGGSGGFGSSAGGYWKKQYYGVQVGNDPFEWQGYDWLWVPDDFANSSSFYYWPSIGLTALGTGLGIGEYYHQMGNKWRGVNRKWYPLSWGGNQYAGSRTTALNTARSLRYAGRAAFFAGVVVSGSQMVSAFSDDNYMGAAKSGLDIGMGAVGTFGGPVGLGTSVVYFGVDATIGWSTVYSHTAEYVLSLGGTVPKLKEFWQIYNRR